MARIQEISFMSVLPALLLGILASGAAAQPAGLPACAMGVQVRDFLRYPATIVGVDAAKGSYNLRRENGSTYWTSAQDLRLACRHEAPAPARSAASFVGEWGVFVGSAWTRSATDASKDVYGPGGQGGRVSVRADGTYTWTIAGKPVSGRWRELAAAEVGRGAKPPAILLTRAYDGKDWQMSTEGRVSEDNRESFSLDEIPRGVTMMVTRLGAAAAAMPPQNAAPAAVPAQNPAAAAAPRQNVAAAALPPGWDNGAPLVPAAPPAAAAPANVRAPASANAPAADTTAVITEGRRWLNFCVDDARKRGLTGAANDADMFTCLDTNAPVYSRTFAFCQHESSMRQGDPSQRNAYMQQCVQPQNVNRNVSGDYWLAYCGRKGRIAGRPGTAAHDSTRAACMTAASPALTRAMDDCTAVTRNLQSNEAYDRMFTCMRERVPG